MKIALSILLVLTSLVTVLLLVGLLIKKEYAIAREIIINKSKNEVFNYVKFQKNQEHYSKWVMTDPLAKKAFRGTDGTVGFVYAWDSENKNVGKGEQEIRKIIDDEKIELEIRFIKPFDGTGYTHMTTESINNDQTKITWGMKGRNKYPFNLMNLFINGILGKDIETSLVTLKNVLENKPMVSTQGTRGAPANKAITKVISEN